MINTNVQPQLHMDLNTNLKDSTTERSTNLKDSTTERSLEFKSNQTF